MIPSTLSDHRPHVPRASEPHVLAATQTLDRRRTAEEPYPDGVSGRWRAQLAAEPAVLAGLRHDVQQRARDAGVDPELVPSVALAVHELVVNSMEHAYGWDATCRVSIDVWTDHDRLVVEVHDLGSWIRGAENPGRGLGLRLVRAVGPMEVRTDGAGSTVRFTVPRTADSS